MLTQQIHPGYHAELRDYFPRMTVFEPHDVTYPQGLAAAGLRLVDVRTHTRPVSYGLGELVFALTAAPWIIPDFDLETDLAALLRLERERLGLEGIVLSDRRYIVEARQPA